MIGRVNNVGDSAFDRAEFDQLVGSLRAELHMHCYRLLGSVHDADDALQEAMLRAWRSRANLTDPQKFRPWLYKIATNRCLTMLEQRGRRELPMDSAPNEPAAERIWLDPFPGLGARASRDRKLATRRGRPWN